MIIVEGTDGLGKTTLCQALLKQLPTHVYSHFTRLPKDFDYYWGYKERISPNIVQDRFHMSEIAYSRAQGKETKLVPEMYRLVDAVLRQAGAFTVVLTAADELIRDRGIQKDEMYNLEQILSANSWFTDMCLKRSIGYAYKPDVDLYIYLDKEHPYVNEFQIATILEGYRRRRAIISNIFYNQPTSLKAFDIL